MLAFPDTTIVILNTNAFAFIKANRGDKGELEMKVVTCGKAKVRVQAVAIGLDANFNIEADKDLSLKFPLDFAVTNGKDSIGSRSRFYRTLCSGLSIDSYAYK